MADENPTCVPAAVLVQETPLEILDPQSDGTYDDVPRLVLPGARAPRVRKPKAPLAAPVDPLAALEAKLDALTELVSAQTALITALLARPAVAPPAPVTNGGVPPGALKVVGERNARYTCPCLGLDGKVHGPVTINRFGNCPDCYTDAHFAKSRKAA